MRAGIEPTRPYELGVLFVHGIGVQRRGETLTQCGGALVQGLQDLLGRTVSAPDLEGRGAGRVTVEQARLEDTSVGELPSAELRLDDVQGMWRRETPWAGQPGSRWLLAESCWADAFPEPTLAEVLAWLVGTLPPVLVTHYDRRFRRAVYQWQNPDYVGSRVWGALRLAREFLSVLLALAVVPPLLLLLLAVTLAGFLPIPLVEPFARWAQRVLAMIIGDSYVLLAKPIPAAAILERVKHDAEVLAGRCHRVAIVAHSQGGAIAHSVLRNNPLLECDLLLTYGSGLHKLALIERLQRYGGAPRLWASTSLSFVGMVSLGLWVDGLASWWAALAGLLSVGVSWTMLLRWLRGAKEFQSSYREQWQADQELYKERFRLPRESGRWREIWMDVFATEDPVPNGPLMDEYVPRRLWSWSVTNLGSAFSDHTAYWKSRDDFVPLVTRRLLEVIGLDAAQREPELDNRLATARHRREWRVACRRAAWWVGCGVVFLAGWRLLAAPPAWSQEWLAALARWLSRVPGLGSASGEVLMGGFRSWPGATLGLGALLLLEAGLLALWSWWDHDETGLYADRRQYPLWSLPGVTYAGVMGGLLCSALGWATNAVWGSGLALAFAVAVTSATLAVRRDWRPWSDRLRVRTASGPRTELAPRRTRLSRAAQDWLARTGHRRALYAIGSRQVRSDREDERHQGEVNLEAAARLGLGDAARILGYYRWRDKTPADLEGARAAFELGRQAEDADSGVQLGRLLEEGFQDTAGAVQAYREVLARGPDAQAARSLALLWLRFKPPRRRPALAALKQGVALADALSCRFLAQEYARGARDRARRNCRRSSEVLEQAADRLYEQALRAGDGSAAVGLGELREDRGDPEGALSAYRDGERLRLAEAALRRGRLLRSEGRTDEAEMAWRRAAELAVYFDPSQSRDRRTECEAAWELGRLAEERHQTRVAERLYRAALGSPGTRDGVGEAALRLADLAGGPKWETRRRIKQALARGLQLGSVAAGLRLANMLEQDYVRLPTQRALLRRLCVLELDHYPRTGEAHYALGSFLERRDYAYEAALESYGKAMELGHEPARTAAVSLCLEHEDPERAIRLVQQRRLRLPGPLRQRLARLLRDDGRLDLLEAWLATWYPTDAEEYGEYGDALETLGRHEPALQHYGWAMQRGSAAAAQRLVALAERVGATAEAERARRWLRTHA